MNLRWFLVVGWMVCEVAAQTLPLFGELPKFEASWNVREQGKVEGVTNSWNWIILTNRESNEVLSIASYQLPSKLKPGGLAFLMDSAGEIFPAGDPVWSPKGRGPFSLYVIRNSVVKLGYYVSSLKRSLEQEALEHTVVQVSEKEPIATRTNYLAHGYVMVFGDVAVFVQHTSAKPIPDEVANLTAQRLLSAYRARNPAPKREE